MEQILLKAKMIRNAIGSGIGARLSESMLPTAILSGAAAALLALYCPMGTIAPFGLGCISGVWYAGVCPYFACLGAFAGYAVSGNYAYAAAAALLCAGIYLIESRKSVGRIYRLLIAFAIAFFVLSAASAFEKAPFLYALEASSLSLLSAVILGHGVYTLGRLTANRELSDADILTLAASAGLVTLCFGNFNVLGQSPAMVFAGICVLLTAYRCGAASVAFAVTVGAGRAMATGGDMHFIAVLAAATLIAAALRSVGKYASALGFLGTNLIILYFIGGTGIFSIFEASVSSAVFLLIPARLYMPRASSPSSSEGKRTAVGESRYTSLQYNITGLAEVLRGLAAVYGGEPGDMLTRISDTLRRTVSGSGSRREALFGVDAGAAGCRKDGSARSGDSCIICNIGSSVLLCISDGMGSGEAAGRESRQTVELLKDLLSVGFDMKAAAGCINGLMARRAADDMYSTLDAMLINTADGSAEIVKLGAVPGYVLRGGRLFTLYAENLPVGIIDGAETPVRKVALKKGDTVVMMTDGASDALGSGLAAAVDCAAGSEDDMQTAAEKVLDAAYEKGGTDDMTVLLARIR